MTSLCVPCHKSRSIVKANMDFTQNVIVIIFILLVKGHEAENVQNQCHCIITSLFRTSLNHEDSLGNLLPVLFLVSIKPFWSSSWIIILTTLVPSGRKIGPNTYPFQCHGRPRNRPIHQRRFMWRHSFELRLMTLRTTARFLRRCLYMFLVYLRVHSSYFKWKRNFEYQLKNFTKKMINAGIHSRAIMKLIENLIDQRSPSLICFTL